PAAIVRWGTRGIQRTVVGRLDDIADRIEREGIRPPAVLVVGQVVELREQLAWVEQRPLFGQRIVVTRSAEQAAGLVLDLSSCGADAVVFPCLGVAPPEDPAALARAVASIGEHDGLILSSPNGVRAFFDALDQAGLDVRSLAGRHVAVIGSGTATACIARGLRPDLVPDRARAEGLIDALASEGRLSARWLHVRADEGRGLLGKAIVEAGGHYTLAIGYRTTRPQVSARLLASLRPPADGGEGFDAVALASGKAARHLLQTLGEAWGEAEARARLDAATIVCRGPVTRAAVETLGVRVDATATAPTDEAVAEALRAALGSSPDS
ncbi:MAG: uroporphyrinogen-III synthase, partial [Deltaproteobacteria bacterium]|nr:uroporphyrinogen-III synthase [Deltaproteobacteria bacterium]